MGYRMPMTPEERYALAMRQQQMALNNDPLAGQTFDPGSPLVGQTLDPGALEAAGGLAMPPPPDLSTDGSVAKAGALERMARSTGGMESRLKSQQAYADSLRATPGAKLQRVGPSNIAVANPWDGLEVGFNRALGGYLSGRMGDDYAALDTAKGDQVRAKAEYEDLLAQEARSAASQESSLDRGLRKAIADQTTGTTIRGQDMTAAAAAASQRGQDARAVTTASFFNPNANEPGQSPVLTYRKVGDRVVDNDNNPVDTTGLTPYSPRAANALDPTSAKPTAAQINDQADEERQLAKSTSRFANIDNLAQYSAADANRFSGWNPQAVGGKFAIGPDGKKAQQFQKMLDVEQIGGLLPAISEARLTPVSDSDVKMVAKQYVDASEQPETIAQFYAYNGRQFMERTIAANVGGPITAAEGEDIQRQYDLKTANLALNWGYPAEDLITAGYNPKLVAYIAEKIRREKEGQ